GEVAGIAMAPGGGGMAQPPAEDDCHGFARDVAAANHRGAPAFDRNLVMIEQGEHAARSARYEAAPMAPIESGDTGGADRIDVLVGVDRIEEPKGIDAFGHWRLQQDAGGSFLRVAPCARF